MRFTKTLLAKTSLSRRAYRKAICRNVFAEYFCKFTYYLVIIFTFSQI